MRSLLIAASLLAISATTPATAWAATLDLAGEFQAVCLANRPQFTKAIQTAKSRGFTVQPSLAKPAPPMTAMLTLVQTTDSGRWAVVIATGAGAATATKPAEDFLACTVVASGAAPGAVDALKRWVGLAPTLTASSRTQYYFREEGGRRLPLNPTDAAAMTSAINNGGFYLFQIDVVGQTTVATITRSIAAK